MQGGEGCRARIKMLVEVYLTIFGILALLLGLAWLLIRRPVTRRWQMETRLETQQKEEAEHEKALREAALREVENWTRETPEQGEEAAEERQENRRL